jgi:hypothetical protein
LVSAYVDKVREGAVGLAPGEIIVQPFCEPERGSDEVLCFSRIDAE